MPAESAPPLWAAVLDDLRTRLARGEFAERFPTDRELTAHYGISRHTAREAVRRLGVVDRRPRLGGRIRRPPTALENLGATLQALGVRLTLAGASRRRRRSRRIASALGVTEAKPMDVLVQVLLADGQPLLVSELWLPAGCPLSDADVAPLLGVGASSEIARVVDESVLPAVATAETSDALNLPAGAAVFCADQLIAVPDHPGAWHRAFIRPERYRCVVRWEPASDGPNPWPCPTR